MPATKHVRLAAKRVAAHFGLLPVYHQTRESFQRMRETAVDRRYRLDEAHLRLLLAWALDEGANCVDVGANVGDVLRDIVRCAPRGKHIAFEPLPDLQAQLCRDFPSVEVHRLAL